jgi:glycosyltransferase involved in cell wall biosynthesis
MGISQMRKFTIILPIKGGLNYVKICVEHVLAQTYPHFELAILIHDNDDGTLEWLQSLKDERIHIYNASGVKGINGNWARILDIPKQEFMTILGYDDVLLPNFLEQMNSLIEEHPNASLYQAHFDYIDANGNFVRHCKPMPSKITVDEFIKYELNQTMDSMATGYIMRSKDYDAIGGIPTDYPNIIFADYALWVKLTMKGYLAVEQSTLFQYRLHNSVSRITNGEDYAQAYLKYLGFLNELQQENKNIKAVLNTDGKQFMLYFCESLSHRLLKTPLHKRTMKVSDFIKRCEEYAGLLIPHQSFEPLRVKRIRLAEILDQNALFRFFFKVVKQMTLLFSR